MTSSFVRAAKGPGKVTLPGTRPGVHGLTMVSTGLPDLDQILGGGLPLGTILLVLEDTFAPHHLVLMRYFLAQGAAHGQSLFFASPLPSPRAFLGTLPAVMSEEAAPKANESLSEKNRVVGSQPDSDDGLRIAWQYRRFISERDALEARRQRQLSSQSSSISSSASSPCPSPPPTLLQTEALALHPPHTRTSPQANPMNPSSSQPSSSFQRSSLSASSSTGRQSSGLASGGAHVPAHRAESMPGQDFCSGFDLRKPMDRTMLTAGTPQCVHIGAGDGALRDLHGHCHLFLSKLASHSESGKAPRVGRIGIQSLGAPQCQVASPDAAWAMLAWLHMLRGQLRVNHAAALVTFPAALYPPHVGVRMQHLADAVLSVEALQEEDKAMAGVVADYGDALGLLRVHKVRLPNTLVPSVPETMAYAMKVVRRRKVVLEPLHPLPVDATPGEGGSTSSAAALLCAGPKEAASKLDF